MDSLSGIGQGISVSSQWALIVGLMKAKGQSDQQAVQKTSLFMVPRGQLTFDAEGLENPGGKFHSRTPHVPSLSSGITLGRGFDLGTQSISTIKHFLTRSGLSAPFVDQAAGAAGLRGKEAKQYLDRNPMEDLSAQQQWNLFNLVYETLEQDVRRIASKPDTVTTYGSVDWDVLSPKIKDVVVDLRYRGDYTPETRRRVQPFLVNNDPSGFADLLADRDYWVRDRGVPEARFQVRRDHF